MPIDAEQLTIVRYPDPVLQRRADPVETIDDEVRAVAARMIELMYEAEGIGLAAPQVGLGWRLFVTRGVEDDEPDRIYVNPVLSEPGSVVEPFEEGCLSLPHVTVEVRRPTAIRIEATDLEGEVFALQRDDMLARVWQHEYDHLEGRLIIDNMSPMDRIANRKAIKQLENAAKSRRR